MISIYRLTLLVSDVPPPQNVVRTKEETEAAQDLLELSRSLPPLPCPAPRHVPAGGGVSQPGAPPTPPTPDTEHHYTTLIYITAPPGIILIRPSTYDTC